MLRPRRLNRRTGLWLFGAVVLVLQAALLSLEARLWAAGGPGIIGFELAGTREAAQRILVEWGEDGRAAARLSLWLDFAYLAAYGAFFTLAVAAVRDGARRRGWPRLARVGSVVLPAAGVAALLDAVENGGLLLTLAGQGGDTAPMVAALAAAGKFVSISLAIAYVGLGVLRGAHARWRRVTRVAVLGVVVLSAGWLYLNDRRVRQEVRPARADLGRIVSLPGGDVHVRSEGDPRNPPLVLIHGYGGSMRWWDRVAPTLADRQRVIRIDLLGFGGSEKPAAGYAMRAQADLVAGAMRRLGVRRAPVVAHSLGGWVGVSLVERHPALVSRLMTIGTPVVPAPPEHRPPLGDRLAFMPFIGPAIRTLAPQEIVRARLEQAFPPEVDLPPWLVEDLGRATFTSLVESGNASHAYRQAKPLTARLSGRRVLTVLVVGTRDEFVDVATVRRVARSRLLRKVILRGAGHTPQIERPEQTAALILAFTRAGVRTPPRRATAPPRAGRRSP